MISRVEIVYPTPITRSTNQAKDSYVVTIKNILPRRCNRSVRTRIPPPLMTLLPVLCYALCSLSIFLQQLCMPFCNRPQSSRRCHGRPVPLSRFTQSHHSNTYILEHIHPRTLFKFPITLPHRKQELFSFIYLSTNILSLF